MKGPPFSDYRFDEHYAHRGEVWHVVSSDFLAHGRSAGSAIQMKWEKGASLWTAGRFIVLPHHRTAGCARPAAGLRTHRHRRSPADRRYPPARLRGGSAPADVADAVDEYIHRYRLFSGTPRRAKRGSPRFTPAPHRPRRTQPDRPQTGWAIPAGSSRATRTWSWSWAVMGPCSRRSAANGGGVAVPGTSMPARLGS